MGTMAIGFVTPVIVYLALYLFARSSFFSKVIFVAAVVIALMSILTVTSTVFSSQYWSEGTRVAWTDVAVAGNVPLVVGGPREEAVVAWPNGSFTPSMKTTLEDGKNPYVEIAGGEGFIFDEDNKNYLNGEVVPVGQSQNFGDYSIRVSNSFLYWRKIEVLSKDNNPLATFYLRTFGGGIDRSRSLRYLIENNTVKSLSDIGNVAARDNLNDWASDIRLLVDGSGQIHILDKEKTFRSKLELPARFSVKWTNLNLPVGISRNISGHLSYNFESPWRLSCPIPPIENGKDPQLVMTGYALPGDYAFLLPLGHNKNLGESLHKLVTISANYPHKFVGGTDNQTSGRESYSGLRNLKEFQNRKVGSSQIRVESGPYFFGFATVNDLPGQGAILFLLGLAFSCFVVGLCLAYPRMPAANLWVVYGLAAIIWNFLAFRLLLAFRYALDPNTIDGLAISGVTRAFVALTVVPGMILLLARLRCDWHERPADNKGKNKAIIFALAFLALLVVGALIAFYRPPHLWIDLPPRYFSSLSWGYTGFFSLLLFYLASYIKFLYKPDSKGKLKKALAYPWSFAEDYLKDKKIALEKLKKKAAPKEAFTWRKGISFLFGALVYFTVFPFVFTSVTALLINDKSIQEVVVPILFYWAPALFWMRYRIRSLINYDRPFSREVVLELTVYAIATILFPIVFVPLAIKDVGSVLAVFAVFIPLTFLLIAGPLRKTYSGVAIASAFIVVFMIAGLVYQNLDLMPTGILGTAKARLLNFREGSYIQHYLIWANSVKGADSEELPFQQLLNGYQHTWENKAIAHEGGTDGLGFGNAPVHRSYIRQDTLQFDSTFSFYIASEYGFWGGVLLLLFYASPLILILVGARDRFDAGYGLAALITSSFLLEALFHAGMNLGTLPMTGRSLPLITVNSLSDLFRWSLFLGIAVQTIFWRYRGNGEIKEDAVSIISPTNAPPSALAAAASRETHIENLASLTTAKSFRHKERLWNYLTATASVLLVPVLMLTAVSYSGWKTVLDEERVLGQFSYGWLLDDVRNLIKLKIIKLEPGTLSLTIDKSKLINSSDDQLIQQQIARFNALSREEKIEEMGSSTLDFIQNELKDVRTTKGYQSVLEKLARKNFSGQGRQKNTLFRLIPLSNEKGDEENEADAQYRVIANPDFNVRLSFNAPRKREEIPQTSISSGKNQIPLIGPSWVMGQWVSTINPDAPLPWISYLRGALEDEWKRLKSEAAFKRYGTLTIDTELHKAAMEFTAQKGNELHEELLKASASKSSYMKKLPPRIALSIISLPSGETLALGGWPHMSSNRYWLEGDGAAGWLPPLEWIDREAPRSFRARYGGDRNFDRSLLMGSSTKPLWAAAALAIHPDLDKQLRVSGPGGSESKVFGISVDPPWDTHESGWTDFSDYLAYSDNRYQVRLGFLALAEKLHGPVMEDGPSSSENESMSGSSPQPWKRYPKFPQPIVFSKSSPSIIVDLQATELATYMKAMYSAGIVEKEFSGRLSFWTKKENDDLINSPSPPEDKPSSLFLWASPEAVNFAFDEFAASMPERKSPRDFITILLGGGTNLWSNVDFSAAFGTCVTGNPVVAHIVKNQEVAQPLGIRKPFTDIAAKLRPGLADVMTKGTAFSTLRKSSKGIEALALIESLKKTLNIEVYAKTGTLKSTEGTKDTSRIVLTIIKWKDKAKGLVESGLVFSVVGENAQQGRATEWLGEFLVTYQDLIRKRL